MTTPDPAAVLRRLDAEATPGRWEPVTRTTCSCGQPADHGAIRTSDRGEIMLAKRMSRNGANDVRLIATLRNAVPALAELIEAAEERVAIGHDEGCETRWPHRSRPCTCGHDALSAALGKVRGAVGSEGGSDG